MLKLQDESEGFHYFIAGIIFFYIHCTGLYDNTCVLHNVKNITMYVCIDSWSCFYYHIHVYFKYQQVYYLPARTNLFGI